MTGGEPDLEEKSRNRFAILIAVILTAAVVYSFAVNLFYETPSVGLATDSGAVDPEDDPSVSGQFGVRVEITPDTVQNVIGNTISRYRSYSRTIQIEYLSEGRSQGALSAEVFVDGEWTRVDVTSPSGVEHTLIGEEECYRWYDGESDFVVLPAEEGLEDLTQRIPTYETVLELPRSKITAAGYETRGGVSCIYVAAQMDDPDYTERYWVSVESGLLVCAETVKGEDVVYRMTAYEVESPLTGEGDYFSLPNDVMMHRAEE